MRTCSTSTATVTSISSAPTRHCSRRRSTTRGRFHGTRCLTARHRIPFFPLVHQVVDSVIADFNNDGRMDMFLLSGVQLRASSVVQDGSNEIEAQLANGTKGFTFSSSGVVTLNMDWNKADEGTSVDLAKIKIGAGGKHPRRSPLRSIPPIRPWLGCRRRRSLTPTCRRCRSAITSHPAVDAVHCRPPRPRQPRKSSAKPTCRSAQRHRSPISRALDCGPVTMPILRRLLMNYPGAFVNTTVAAGLGAPSTVLERDGRRL